MFYQPPAHGNLWLLFEDIVNMTNLSGDQKRQLKEMAASMQPPTVSRHEDYRSSVDDRRAGPSRPPPIPCDADRFRSKQFVPQHSATVSHPAGPAFPPIRSGGYEVFSFYTSLHFKSFFAEIICVCSTTTQRSVGSNTTSTGGLTIHTCRRSDRGQAPHPLALVIQATG